MVAVAVVVAVEVASVSLQEAPWKSLARKRLCRSRIASSASGQWLPAPRSVQAVAVAVAVVVASVSLQQVVVAVAVMMMVARARTVTCP